MPPPPHKFKGEKKKKRKEKKRKMYKTIPFGPFGMISIIQPLQILYAPQKKNDPGHTAALYAEMSISFHVMISKLENGH